jgi:hypothetical protein
LHCVSELSNATFGSSLSPFEGIPLRNAELHSQARPSLSIPVAVAVTGVMAIVIVITVALVATERLKIDLV